YHAAQSLGALATGVDLSPAMVAAARGRPGGRAPEFLIGDARALLTRPAGFDAVAANFTVLETGDAPRCLREAHGALKPGGRLAWTCWPGPSGGRVFELVETAVLSVAGAQQRSPMRRGLAAEAAEALTRAAGFTDVASLTLELAAPADPAALLDAAAALDPAAAPRFDDPAAARRAMVEALQNALHNDLERDAVAELRCQAVMVMARRAGGDAGDAGAAAPGAGPLARMLRWLRGGRS
ncbi:MAG: class I SAM-dependent methyltransferase, partial [Pseudomonadota bacterium]